MKADWTEKSHLCSVAEPKLFNKINLKICFYKIDFNILFLQEIQIVITWRQQEVYKSTVIHWESSQWTLHNASGMWKMESRKPGWSGQKTCGCLFFCWVVACFIIVLLAALSVHLLFLQPCRPVNRRRNGCDLHLTASFIRPLSFPPSLSLGQP